MVVNLVVFGAKGRMGGLICELAKENDGIELSGVVDVVEGKIEGLDITHPEDAFDEFKNADVVVEFSSPEGLSSCLELALETNTALVSGTTGISDEIKNKIKEVSEQIPIVRSRNFASGVNVFWSLIEELSRFLSSYDFEVAETHHRHKKDSPSGTALEAVERIQKGLGENREKVYGRHGEQQRKDEIGIHSRRAGEVVGEHEVLAAGDGEEIVVKHRAENRKAFASGAINACLFAAEKQNGLYSVDDMLSSPS